MNQGVKIEITGGTVLVSPEDEEMVRRYKWHVSSNGYVRRAEGRKAVYLHAVIAGTLKGGHTDHKYHDKMDCRREKLRAGTVSQNHQNRLKTKNPTSSKYKGVSYCKARDRWESYIKHNHRKINLGRFLTESDAAMAYDAAAREMWGERALLNIVDAKEGLARHYA